MGIDLFALREDCIALWVLTYFRLEKIASANGASQ